MKIHWRFSWFALVLSGMTLAASAEETAVVTENRVNVRGQASLFGEVITQLQQGEKVTVLEYIVLEKPKQDEPAKWAKIQIPGDTPVWVFASFIDPVQKTVTVNRLNLRAGPGENYSVLGRLERGTEVKDIRTVDEWMEIETPTNAYAFVAAELIAPVKEETAVAEAKPAAELEAAKKTAAAEQPPITSDPEKPVSEPVAPATVVETTEPGKVELAKTEPLAPQPETQTIKVEPPPAVAVEPAKPIETNVAQPAPPAVTPEKTADVPPAANPNPAPSNVPAVVGGSLPPVAPAPSLAKAPQTPIRRVVRREGVVRTTISVQAPTYFELISPETRKTINYLHTEDPDIKLKQYRGQSVIVTGVEGIDPRWPNTPVIEIQTIEVAP